VNLESPPLLFSTFSVEKFIRLFDGYLSLSMSYAWTDTSSYYFSITLVRLSLY